jgi:hypothetical protein
MAAIIHHPEWTRAAMAMPAHKPLVGETRARLAAA